MVAQKVEEKIEKYLRNSPEKKAKVINFLKNPENADYNVILEACIDIDQTFKALVDKIVKEVDKPVIQQKPSAAVKQKPSAAAKQKPSAAVKQKPSAEKWKGKPGAIPDCGQTSNNIARLWNGKDTVIRLTGKFAGAVVGTAISPGIGTVLGGIAGGQMSTSLACMFQSRIHST